MFHRGRLRIERKKSSGSCCVTLTEASIATKEGMVVVLQRAHMRQPGASAPLSQILSARAIKHVEFLLAENLPQAVGRLEEEEEPLFHHVRRFKKGAFLP